MRQPCSRKIECLSTIPFARDPECVVSVEYTSCWVHQDCHAADEQKIALKKAAGVSGGKDECQVRLKGREHDYWMGTEVGMLGGYGFVRKKAPAQISLNWQRFFWHFVTR